MASIELAEGEYIIWSSPCSRTTRIGGRQLVGFFFLSFYLLGASAGLIAATGLAGLIASFALLIATVLLVRWNRNRVLFFMTNQHLIEAGFIFKERIPLVSIQGCERYVQEVYTRYGVERILTDKMVILSAGQAIKYGPVMDFEGLWELIHHGVLGKSIQISALPALDGGLAPAEKRTDLLLVLSTKTDGDEYGPLFIGPSKIVRFTEKLPSILERILFTVAAGQNTAHEMEQHIEQLVKHPQAGHMTILDRELTAATVEGNMLTLTASDKTIKMELRPQDVTRVNAFVRAWRPAHPMR